MNWGWKITLVYLGFVAMILTLVFKANKESIDLVAPDYYAQELEYQGRNDAINRTKRLSHPIEVQSDTRGVRVQFPDEVRELSPTGEVRFFRPSDSSLDKVFPLLLNDNSAFFLPHGMLLGGYYLIQVRWVMNSEDYYFEESIFIP